MPRPKQKPRRRPPAVPPPPPIDVVGEVVGETPPPPAPPPAPAATPVTWIDWYNHASADDQAWFDRAASVIDNGGAPYQRGGSQEAYVENWKSRGADFYNAIVNYRDTGGRKGLFAVPPKDYGTKPVSTEGSAGPIERLGPGLAILHPGRYTYSDVTSNGPAFRQWLTAMRQPAVGHVQGSVALGQTQASTAVLGGDPYYVDYEFIVLTDTPWPDQVNGQPLHGLPTWLPTAINIVDYWGQVTTSHPDWGAPLRAAQEAAGHAADMVKQIATLAAILGTVYVVYSLRPNHSIGPAK